MDVENQKFTHLSVTVPDGMTAGSKLMIVHNGQQVMATIPPSKLLFQFCFACVVFHFVFFYDIKNDE